MGKTARRAMRCGTTGISGAAYGKASRCGRARDAKRVFKGKIAGGNAQMPIEMNNVTVAYVMSNTSIRVFIHKVRIR